MKIIVFKLSSIGYLGYKLLEGNAEVLIEFFLSDVGFGGESFIKFVNNPNEDATTSNYSWLIKEGDDIWVSCQFDDDPYENGIKISQKELVSLLNKWRELVKQRPQEIVVYKEGESYRLEGHGFPDKQE